MLSLCVLLIGVAHGLKFSVTPSTFVPEVTSSVTMRCDVSDTGASLSQLLLLQVDMTDRGNAVPLITFTPGHKPLVSEEGTAASVSVEGTVQQFDHIGDSYLSIVFPFPARQVASNYTCLLSGLSTTGLLVRVTAGAELCVGDINLLPLFMTDEAAHLRVLVEKLKADRAHLMEKANQLRKEAHVILDEMVDVKTEWANITNQLSALRSRASQLPSLLANTSAPIVHLKRVRPGKRVAFHAGMNGFGARTAILHTPLKFDRVFINEGHGYDRTSGVFRAPVAGTYLFTVSVIAGSRNRNSELSIMMGRKILQTMHMAEDSDYQHSSTTTIAKVPAGAEVTCEFTWVDGMPGYVGSTEMSAPYVTGFTGYILW